MKLKKGDQVLIISGKYRGKKGKVLKAFPKKQRLLIEGINLRKKHVRPKREGEKGQIVELPAPIHISNVKLICSKCKKATKVGFKVISKRTLRGRAKGFSKDQKSKVRICKKCGQEI